MSQFVYFKIVIKYYAFNENVESNLNSKRLRCRNQYFRNFSELQSRLPQDYVPSLNKEFRVLNNTSTYFRSRIMTTGIRSHVSLTVVKLRRRLSEGLMQRGDYRFRVWVPTPERGI